MSGGYGTQPYGLGPYGGVAAPDPEPPEVYERTAPGFPALSLRVCNPDGTYGPVLPADVGCELLIDDGSPNAIKLDYDAQSPTADLLDHLVVVACLVGGVEYPDMRFVLDDSGRDEVLDENTVSWAAQSVMGQFDYGIVLPDLGDLENSAGHPLPDVTPGFAARTLIEKCQARGALTWCSLGFTDGSDSAGQAWPNSSRLTEIVEQGTTILGFLEKLHERRIASARMDGTTLQLYAYGNQGLDLSQDASGLILRGRDLEDGPWNSTTRAARSVMYARGELPRPEGTEGLPDPGGDATSTGIPILVSEINSSAHSRFGVREGWLSQQQVETESQLRAIASGSLALTNRARDSYTYKLTMAGPLPLVDYSKGDVLQVRVKDRDRQMRVRSITINRDPDGYVTGSVAFGDRYMDADEELQRRLDRLTAGSMDGGLYGAPMVNPPTAEDTAGWVRIHVQSTDAQVWAKLKELGYQGILTPTGETLYVPKKVLEDVLAGLDITNPDAVDQRDSVPPGPVENLTASSFPLISGSNLNTTEIRLAWTMPSDDDVAWAEIQWQDLEYERHQDTNYWVAGATINATPSGGGGNTWSHSLRRPGVLYRYRVRLIDNWYNVSTWTYVEHRAEKYLEPPAQRPSMPGVEAILYSALRVTWDGLDEDGVEFTPFPVYTVQVHASTTANFTATSSTRVGLITVGAEGFGGELIVHDLSAGDTWYVRLLAVSPWGIEGEPAAASDANSGVPLDVFSQTLPDGSIDPSKLSFNPGDGNLTPDGSFERAAWRAETAAEGLWTMVDSGAYGGPKVAGKPAASGFVDAGVSSLQPLVAPTTTGEWAKQTTPPPDWAAFPARMNTTPLSTVGGLVRKTGSGFAPLTSARTLFDSSMLYRVSIQVRVVTNSTNPVADQTMAVGLSAHDSSGQFLDANGAVMNTWYGLKIPAARAVFSADGIQTISAYYRGTGAQVTGTGTLASPMAMPINTNSIAIQAWLDYDNDDPSLANTTVEIVQATIRPMTGATYDGDWVYDFAPHPSAWQRMDLVNTYPTKGDDVFYVVARWRLMGSRTNQPMAYFVGIFKDAQGDTLFTSFLRKNGGWTHDGWYVVEGRLSMGAEDQDFRPAGNVASVEIYLAAWNVGSGQTLRVDAIEVRRAMTNVLIHNLAVTDAKIRDLSVSKLTAGTVNAQVIVGGQISTAQQAGSLARVAMLSRTSSGTGYAAFAATSDAGVATVLINGETGGARFGGTLTANEVEGWIRARYGDAYLEFNPSVWSAASGWGPGLQYVDTTTWTRTPGNVKLNGTDVVLSPAQVHLVGTAQNLVTASSFSQGIIVSRLNDTPAADVESVTGYMTSAHPYGELTYMDSPFGHAKGQATTLAIISNQNGRGAVGIRCYRNTGDAYDVWMDFVRTGSGIFGASHLWTGVRADQFASQSAAASKTSFQEPDVSAVAIVRDNPSTWWQRKDSVAQFGADRANWYWGPMVDDVPDWLKRRADNDYVGFSLGDQIGLVWRATEELAERDDDVRLQLRALARRLDALEAPDG